MVDEMTKKKKPEGAWDSGSKGEGVNGCKGPGDGPVATGSVGCVGLGQSARLKGTWVGLLWL